MYCIVDKVNRNWDDTMIIWMLFTACTQEKIQQTDSATVAFDEDGDGFTLEEDCDDNNPDINPQAEEVCDLLDNDDNNIAL